MSFFVSDDIKDLISEEQLTNDVPQTWSAYAASSEKAYKILELIVNQGDYIVKLEVSGNDIAMFLKNSNHIKSLNISNERFDIAKQKFIKFITTQQADTYIAETYLCSA